MAESGSHTGKAPSAARAWAAACVVALAVEALLNWASIIASADYSFSPKVSCARVAIMLCVFALYRVFGRKSRIWRVPLDLSKRPQLVALCILLVALCVFLVGLSRISGQAGWLERGAVYEDGIQAVQDGNQYNHLADAFLAGRVDLDLPQSEILLSMENPYDTPLRQQLNVSAHEPIYWDYAFYDGKYYCYFGALPCILTFLPFKAITGHDLRTDYVVVLFACLAVVAGAVLLYQLARTYFRELSFGAYVAGVVFLFCSGGILEQVFLPRIYPIPILSALFFCFFGFALLLKAKRRFQEGNLANKALLAGGALCVACTLGCRPQYVLSAALIIVLFWREIREGRFFSRAGMGNTLAVIVPFLVVAVPVCLYNYVRFASPFDFGASYNLTGADMTAYSFDPLAIAARSLEYLFLPPVMQSGYPFVHAIDEVAELPTCLWTNEPVYGGFFAFAPAAFAVFALAGRKTRSSLARRGACGFATACVALAVVVLIVVSYVSGVTMRYFADFAWLLVLPATLVLWNTMESERARSEIRSSGSLSALVIAGFPLYCWTFLATTRFGALVAASPWIYNGVEALLRFL